MALNPLDKVYLSSQQLQNLADAGTETSGSDTYTGQEDTVYLTDDTSVLFEEQSLTTEQKAQARTNIGAGTSNFDGDYTNLTNKPNLALKEDVSNKVTSLSSASTDTQYPSAKCVYDLIGDVETLLGGI